MLCFDLPSVSRFDGNHGLVGFKGAMEIKGSRRDRKRDALRKKGRKHNYARWKQMLERRSQKTRPASVTTQPDDSQPRPRRQPSFKAGRTGKRGRRR